MVKFSSPGAHSFPPSSSSSSTVRRCRFVLANPLLVLLLATTASADPLLITDGYFRFLFDGAAAVEISGPAFSFGNADSNPEEFGVPGLAIETADPFGATLPVGGHTRPNFNGRLAVNGSGVDSYYTIQFDLNFLGGSAVAQPLDIGGSCVPWGDRCAAVSASAPFQLSGTLITQGFEREELSRLSLTGSGVATVGFLLPDGAAPRAFAEYRFLPPTPVPEPNTLVLVMSGAALAWSVISRRM